MENKEKEMITVKKDFIQELLRRFEENGKKIQKCKKENKGIRNLI